MQLERITTQDLELINNLAGREYSGNTMRSNSTEEERDRFRDVKEKLKRLAVKFKEKYDAAYGPFEISVTSGNPIAIGGTRLNRVWSGIFKGAENKQYAAQLSFVVNSPGPILNVGFYFGRASARGLSAQARTELENALHTNGKRVARDLSENDVLGEKYDELFDYGFKAYVRGSRVNPSEWKSHIAENPGNCEITVEVEPDEYGIVDFGKIDLYISMLLFLMTSIPQPGQLGREAQSGQAPLTPEQRARQAEQRTIIGEKGELFVLSQEKQKLKNLDVDVVEYPKHIAAESRSHRYDILSCDEDGEEMYIEVKTTTRTSSDPLAKTFFMSKNEHDFFLANHERYFLYRVYDINGEPELQEIDMGAVRTEVDNYKVDFE